MPRSEAIANSSVCGTWNDRNRINRWCWAKPRIFWSFRGENGMWTTQPASMMQPRTQFALQFIKVKQKFFASSRLFSRRYSDYWYSSTILMNISTNAFTVEVSFNFFFIHHHLSLHRPARSAPRSKQTLIMSKRDSIAKGVLATWLKHS